MSSDSDTVEDSIRFSDSNSSKFSTEEENPFINSLWGIHETLSALRGMKFLLKYENTKCQITLLSYFCH